MPPYLSRGNSFVTARACCYTFFFAATGFANGVWQTTKWQPLDTYMTEGKVEIIPLGGVGHFGMNMMVIRYGEEAIILDAGMAFPNEDLPGVDILIPDFTVIDNYRDQIAAIVLTHGHEDHIGAVPFVLKTVDVPVYGTHLTLALLENKFDEHGLSESVVTHAVEPRDKVKIGCFEVEWIHVTHSLSSC